MIKIVTTIIKYQSSPVVILYIYRTTSSGDCQHTKASKGVTGAYYHSLEKRA